MVDPLVIERKKLFEHVAEHLEKQILSGKLKPGDQLPPERDLQTTLGVGRPAIREALISLQKAGLVELTNGARARVQMPTATHIFAGMAPAVRQMLSTDDGQRHFQAARLLFEVALVREAAAKATADDITLLEAALSANHGTLGDRDRFIVTDVAFHFEIARIARNPIFIALHDQISDWLREQRAVALLSKGEDQAAYEAHRAILEAIAARDPDRAEAAMRKHLTQGTETFWRQRNAHKSEPGG
jgi:GntR family transcriptional repressor for pyruvate dehydrogenase complex